MMRLRLPKLSGRRLIAALLPVLFLLSACAPALPEETPSTQPPATAPSEPLPTESAPTEALYTDPFPEEAYTPWSVGTVLSGDEFDNAIADHEAQGTVYQVVYDQTWQDTLPTMTERQIYRYDSFPTYSSEVQDTEPVWFRGHTALYLFDNSDTDLPLPSEEYLVNIREPGLYALLEESVFSLPFVPMTESTARLSRTAIFVTRGRDGDQTRYIIYRDGTVLRNDDEISTEILSEDITSRIFAAKYTYTYATMSFCTYADAVMDFNSPVYGTIRVVVRRNGQELELDESESQAFLAQVSNPAEDDPGRYDYSYHSFVRCNGTLEDLGEPVLEFTLMRVYEDGSTKAEKTYTLHESGKVSRKLVYGLSEYRSDIPVLDQLIIDRWLISRTNFDVQAILDSLSFPES